MYFVGSGFPSFSERGDLIQTVLSGGGNDFWELGINPRQGLACKFGLMVEQ